MCRYYFLYLLPTLICTFTIIIVRDKFSLCLHVDYPPFFLIKPHNPFDAAYTFLVPFEDVENGDKCTIVGIIAKVQKKKDKNGKQFAYINIYSSFGLVEGIVWHSTLKEFEDLIKKSQQVAILCKKDSEEKVIVEKIKPYSEWIKYVRKKGAKV